MKIIIIRGTMDSGKTTTSGLVYSELVNISEKEHLFNWNNVNGNSLLYNKKGDVLDFTSVLIVGKIKVGIISAGDVAIDLKNDFIKMISLNIDILICCARSVNKEGSAYRMIINDYSKENKIIQEIWTEYSENSEQKHNIKNKTVKKIISLISF